VNSKIQYSNNKKNDFTKTPKQSKWEKFKVWFKSPAGKRAIPIILIILVILGFFIYTVYVRYFNKNETVQESKNNNQIFNGQEEKTLQCLLDGKMYAPQDAKRHPLAVIIENHTQSRPHSGLDKARIIYEAIAEGGITRFLAIYGPKLPEKIGPIRSARTYFLDWTLEYNAFFAHVGGNMDALDLIPQIGIKDLDQFNIGKAAFWRESRAGRAIEHTMYASPEKLYQVAESKGWEINQSNFTSLQFKNENEPQDRPQSQTIKILFSTNSYNITWKYDPQTNQYLRFMAGSAHKDNLSGKQLTAKNIIIQIVNRKPTTTRINEPGWNFDTIGEGKAKIFLDGREIDATWKKKNQKARTLFYDSQGKQIKFNPGTFWYEIVHPDISVTSKTVEKESTKKLTE